MIIWHIVDAVDGIHALPVLFFLIRDTKIIGGLIDAMKLEEGCVFLVVCCSMKYKWVSLK